MVKQVVVMRKDLNMRKGKMIAQGSHASVNAILNLLKIDAEQMNYIKSFEPHPLFKEWIEHGYTKICVYVNSEEELLDIYSYFGQILAYGNPRRLKKRLDAFEVIHRTEI